jgi:hypothetical protein
MEIESKKHSVADGGKSKELTKICNLIHTVQNKYSLVF